MENGNGNSRLSSHTVVVRLAAFSGLLRESNLETEIVTILPLVSLVKQSLDLLREKKRKRGLSLPHHPFPLGWNHGCFEVQPRICVCVYLEKTDLGRQQHRSGWCREVQGQKSHSFWGQILYYVVFLNNCREGGKIKEWGRRSGRTHMQRATFPGGTTHSLRYFWTLWTWKHMGQWDFQNWNQRKAESCQMKLLKRKFLFKTKGSTEWQMGLFLS